MSSTITLQTVVNLASTHSDLMPLAGVGGYNQEPALSLCNDTLQDLLSAPHDWKFNAIDMPFLVTANTRQDYLFAGATAFTLGSDSAGASIGLGSASAVTVTSGVVTVNTLESHQFSVGDTVYHAGVTMTTGTTANYNSTFTQNATSSTWSGGWVITAVTTKSYSFAAVSGQANGDIGGATGITDFGWLASATARELNNNSSPGNIRPVEAVRLLPVSGRTDNPSKVSVQKDLGTGVVKIRFECATGSTIWCINLVYQAKAPLLTQLSQTWAPFPDEFSYVYRQGLLYRMYRYLNSPMQAAEFQKFQETILKATGADDREASDVHCYPESSLIDGRGYSGYGI